MSCTASKFDRDCGGCRHCAAHAPGATGALHHDYPDEKGYGRSTGKSPRGAGHSLIRALTGRRKK